MAGSSGCWIFFRHIAQLAFMVSVVTGLEDIYSNSYISPNSASEDVSHQSQAADLTSGPGTVVFDVTPTTKQIEADAPTRSHHLHHNREIRSADPVLSKTSEIDNLLIFKNFDENLDSNDVELSGRIAHFIQPSKTIKDLTNMSFETEAVDTSGEVRGAPQPRYFQLSEPQEIHPTATMMANFATLSPLHVRGSRQANPDIQDIITGIVKLLNGNVNVQANTAPAMGRPLRPLSTRINNRGPPRITDVPALPPDFDIPVPPLPPPPPLGQVPPPVATTRMPTPYPFDLPPHKTTPVRPFINGVPLPEQVVPARPGYYRPITIPWKRPPQRRPGLHRRPIPPYKRIPPFIHEDEISLTSEKPNEDILTLDLGSQLQPSPVSEENLTNISDELNTEDTGSTTESDSTEMPDNEEIEFEKNKEKSSSKMDKHTVKLESTESTVPNDTMQTMILSSPTSSSIPPTSMSSDSGNTSDQKFLDTLFAESTPTLPTESTSIPLNESTSVPSTESTALKLSNSSVQPSNVSSEIAPTASLNTTMIDIVVRLNESMVTTEETVSATPTLESSIQEVLQTLKEDLLNTSSSSSTPTDGLPDIVPSSSSSTSSPTTPSIVNQTSHHSFPYYPYRPRPGIVLDDTEYKPGGKRRQPILTARPSLGQLGEIFDITVSAIQGPGSASKGGQGKPYIIPVDIDNVHLGQNADVITSPVGNEGFVSIDGKRTYLNLFGDGPSTVAQTASPAIKPSPPTSNHVTGTGFAVVETENPIKPDIKNKKPTPRRPLYGRRPSQPPVRIDTCIVGDDSTCDGSQHEICRTEAGVSACHCRPGHARRKHRDPCRKVVSVIVSIRVDRLYERRVVWANELSDRNSESYQQLSYETERALESAMSMTPFSDEFLSAQVNSIYRGERSAGQAGVFVNLTLQLEENGDTSRPQIKGDIQRHLLGVIQRRSNNVGNSALWVDSPPGSVSHLQDLDECSSPELHDCHSLARCINVFGGFKCECAEGFKDPWFDNKHRAGRYCEQCPPQHCNNRGECKYQNGQETCFCSGNYYGNQCELDGEVLGVAIGASVAAVIIIGLTLICLVMWSRRWNREQKAAVGSPVFGYMATASNTAKTPVVGGPPYQLTLEDRLRWAQIADVMAQANHYAPEPVTAPTRPSSAVFGYPNLSLAGTLPHGNMHGTLPPVPLPRLNLQAQFANRAASIHGMRPLDNSSSSEEEDKTDLLGRNFQVPRPKSRSNASVANQSGIYYDVDYEQNEIYKHQAAGIPMSTYTVGRQSYYRN